ncbi:hypothetical protein [Maribacter halichondriae]|uniref:hypothetical protein n=1 Tax=Maribacter halichondriae TaxID=2980554 RepID=UPI002359E046|nr:hypothetical protein [Maribacter sp. Hal144]
MQKSHKLITIIVSLVLLNLSCRQEEFDYFPPIEQPNLANSMVADLLERTALNDGSIDNIIDKSNCFTVQLPVIVTVNGTDVLVDNEDDYTNIEAIFDASDDDIDILEILFPITVILSDFTEVDVADQSEFDTLSASCNGENVADDDIECLDIQYPITASIFNQTTEVFDNLSITNDWQLFDFIDDLKSDDIVDIAFPINVILADGSEVSVGNLIALEQIINDAKDSCDEDDDFDYNDDDCNNCSTNQLADLLTSCTNWTVDKLERNDQDLEDNYAGYQFNFAADGTLTAANNSNSFSGTWESNGSGNSIAFALNIPNLSDFNATWNLHEIEQNGGENKFDLRLGDDRLRFESNCSTGGNGGDGDSSGNTGTLASILADGLWVVGSYTEDADDQTSNYSGYTFNFNSDGTAVADNGSITNGIWSPQNSDSELLLNFGNTSPLDEFNDTWDVISVSDTQVEVRDVSGGNGGTDTLILIKQ